MSSLHALLEAAADRSGGDVAVVDSDRSLTWAELDTRANRIANVLQAEGVRPGDRVVLRLTKSTHSIAAAYGIMKCGAAYVPLDVTEPADRSRAAIVDAGATVAIVEPARKGPWDAVTDAGLQMILNLGSTEKEAPAGVRILQASDVELASGDRPGLEVSSDDLAYMLYTSGSTGRRKGVMLTHGNSLAFVEWAAACVNLTADDRLSSHAPMHFDLSVFDFYSAALTGASTWIVPKTASMFPASLATFLAEHRITVWYSVPTVLRLLCERGGMSPGDLPDLRTVVFAGEVYPPGKLTELMTLLPHADYWNWFGPTETNVCTAYHVTEPPGERPSIPIGQPASGAEAFVVDENAQQVEPGTQGELLISGPTVHAGYWGDPERTAQTIVAHPHDPGRRAYLTGDLVVLDQNGDFIFAGRRDHQIKTRGYRVELGDVEAFLQQQEGVQEAVVVAVPNEQFTHLLHAFVIASEDLRPVLVKAARGGLPSYMAPATITCMATLPRTLNDKVDRQALAAKAAKADTGG